MIMSVERYAIKGVPEKHQDTCLCVGVEDS